jgi:GTP-binding protein Era
MPEAAQTATRCGFVALIGAPNVGKSTLVNRLVGAKVSIVTPKVQTTRNRVRGIAMAGNSQIIFVDTPGIFAPRRRLDRAMVAAAWGSAGDADLVALLLDAKLGLDEEARAIAGKLAAVPQKKILIINKIDLVKRERLLALTAEANALAAFERTFMVSATSGDGVADVLAYFAEAVPAGPFHYPADEISDLPERLMAAEITREKLYLRLHQELPYQSTVETDSWKELKDKSVRIEQTIFVERESQRKIVLGEGGKMIKAISMDARKEIAAGMARKVHLFLHVKVREDWENDPERYREMGLEFPKE